MNSRTKGYKYSLIFPVYNEEQTLPELFRRLREMLPQLNGKTECIFVDDGSTDHSLQLLNRYLRQNPGTKILSFSRNFGHQAAVTAGLDFSSGKYVVILDADLQDPPELVPKFLSYLEKGYEVAYAVRKNRKENFLKVIMYDSFYRILHTIANVNIPLDSGDFCAMNRRVVDILKSMPERNRFIRALRSWVGLKQIGIEYNRDARYAGDSKYPLPKLIQLALNGIFSFSYAPLKFLTIIGLTTFLISVVVSFVVVYLRFFTNYFVPGFATTIILIMFLGGLNMFSLGLVGEYVGRIYDEVKQRPPYIIDSVVGFS